jgi:release factor glutamine methyltransferase
LTLAHSAADAARRLAAAGLSADDSRRDAVVLARHQLRWSAATWLGRSQEAAPPGFVEAYDRLVDRRCRREPVAYITGGREFYGRIFHVTPDVLIPRPETEKLVEQAITHLHQRRAADAVPRVLDAGTGSGCIAVTLALEVTPIHLVAADTSTKALGVARSNAERLGAADRIEFRITNLAGEVRTAFDLIVANPPYVPEIDRNTLAPEVRDYEPAGALFAGPDGLEVIRALIPSAGAALKPDGWLMMEIGYGQAESTVELMRAAGFSGIRLVPDLQSIPRVIMGTTRHVPLLPNHQG